MNKLYGKIWNPTFVQEEVDFEGDASSLLRALDQSVKGFDALAREQTEAIKTTVLFNNETEKLQKTLEGTTRDGIKVQATYKAVGDEMVRTKVKVVDTKSEFNKLNQTTKDSVKDSKSFIQGWSLVVKSAVFFEIRAQILRVVSALTDGVKTAAEFQKGIAEIQSISQQNQLGTGQWADELTRLSNSFGLDVLDQTEAAYQSISNQVTKGAETFAFLREANELALTGISTTTEAVNLLSSALNAYGDTVDDIEGLNAKFFKTVELGRVRIGELADDFGRTAVPAAQLGVSLDELLAGIATLTIQGQKANVVQTQLRAIFLKLIKPTTALQKLFDDLGVSTGQNLVQTFGFVGALNILQERTQGSAGELGELASRLRAIQGLLGLTGKNLAVFSANVDKIANSSKSFEAALDIILETPAKKIEIELNKIKNFIINDFGGTIITTADFVNTNVVGLSDAFGTLFSVVSVGAPPVIGALVAINVQLALTSGLAGKATAALGTAFAASNFIPTVAAITAIAIAIKLVADSYSATADAAIEADRKIGDALISDQRKFNASIDARFNTLTRGIQVNIAKIVGTFARLNNGLDTELDEIAKQFEGFSKPLDESLKESETAFNDLVKVAESDLKTIQKQFENTIKEISDSSRSLDLKLFDIGFDRIDDPTAQLEAIAKRIADVTQRAQSAATTGDDSQAKDLLNELIKLQDKRIRLRQTAERNDVKAGEDQKKIQESIAKTEVDAQNKIAELQRKARGDSEKRKSTAEKIRKIEVETVEKVADLRKEFAKIELSGIRTLGLEEQTIKIFELRKQILSDLATQQKAAATAEEASLKRQLDFAQQIAILRKSVSDFSIKDLQDTQNVDEANKLLDIQKTSLKDLIQLLSEQGASSKQLGLLQGQLNLLNEAGAKQLQKLDNTAITKQVTANLEAIKQKQLELAEASKLAGQALGGAEVGALSSQFEQIGKFFDLDTFSSLDRLFKDVNDSARSEFFDILKDGKIAADEADRFRKILKNLDLTGITELEERLANFKFGSGEEFATFQAQLVKLALQARNFNKEATTSVEDSIREQKTALEALQKVTSELKEQASLTKEIATSQKTIAELIQQSANLLPSGSGPAPQGFANGGAVGTDSIRAALSPGEFVVNARAAGIFSNELKAMNSSIPSRFQSGGAVTSFGDINVTVPSNGNASIDARQIGAAIQREVRRNTLGANR